MTREQILLQRLAMDILNIYFKPLSYKDTYKKMNEAVERYLDGCDTLEWKGGDN